MKYIVTEDDNGIQEIFLFPDSVIHKDMAKHIAYINGNDRTPVSAGFANIDGTCHGESISLKLKSRKEDSELLKQKRGW